MGTIEELKQIIEDQKEEIECLENGYERLSEIESSIYKAMYDEDIDDDMKVYKVVKDIVDMKEENKSLKLKLDNFVEKYKKERNKTTRVLDLLQERCDVKTGTCGDGRIKSWGATENPHGVVGYFIDSFKIEIKKLKKENKKLKKENKHNKQVIEILDGKCKSYKLKRPLV
jgi:predicted RNase H-like nuclease (RuvC/YqgF family)